MKAAKKQKASTQGVCEFRDEEGKLRCEGCRDVLFQCADCVELQKGIDKSEKEAAKAAKISGLNAQFRDTNISRQHQARHHAAPRVDARRCVGTRYDERFAVTFVIAPPFTTRV